MQTNLGEQAFYVNEPTISGTKVYSRCMSVIFCVQIPSLCYTHVYIRLTIVSEDKSKSCQYFIRNK